MGKNGKTGKSKRPVPVPSKSEKVPVYQIAQIDENGKIRILVAST